MAVGIASRQVEQVDTGKGNEKAAEEGEGANDVGGVETLEQNEGSTQCGRGECDVVKGVDTAPGQYRVSLK